MMMATKDYYHILGVSENAGSEQIKKAYRRLALKYHPDRVSGKEKRLAEEKFKDISEAYYCLIDKNRRAEYDALRKGNVYGYQGDFARSQGFNFDEILRQFQGFAGRNDGKQDYRFANAFDVERFFDVFDDMGASRSGTQHGAYNSNDIKKDSLKEQDTDVHAQLSVPNQILINGGEAKFKHNGQTIRLKIKPGTKRGQNLRLAGQGRVCGCCRHRGDLIITII
jgi:DnaJ-class molecular chaperone